MVKYAGATLVTVIIASIVLTSPNEDKKCSPDCRCIDDCACEGAECLSCWACGGVKELLNETTGKVEPCPACQPKPTESQVVAQPPAPPAPAEVKSPAGENTAVVTEPVSAPAPKALVPREWFEKRADGRWYSIGVRMTDPDVPGLDLRPIAPQPVLRPVQRCQPPQPTRFGLFGRPMYRNSCGPNGCP